MTHHPLRRPSQRPRRDWPPADFQPDWQELLGEPQVKSDRDGPQLLLPIGGHRVPVPATSEETIHDDHRT
jgi:hypothetical protein